MSVHVTSALEEKTIEMNKRLAVEAELHQAQLELNIYKQKYEIVHQENTSLAFKNNYYDNLNIQLNLIVNKMELAREIQTYTQARAVGESQVSDVIEEQGNTGRGGNSKIVMKFLDRLTAV